MHLNLHATDEQRENIAKAEKRTDTVTNLLLGGVLLAVTVGVVYWFQGQYAQELRLAKDGQRIVGTLDNDYIATRSRSGGVRYNVKYSFVVNGSTYHGSSTLLSRPYSRQAAIIYDPGNPDNSQLESSQTASDGWGKSLGKAIGILFVAYAFSGISLLYRKLKSRRH